MQVCWWEILSTYFLKKYLILSLSVSNLLINSSYFLPGYWKTNLKSASPALNPPYRYYFFLIFIIFLLPQKHSMSFDLMTKLSLNLFCFENSHNLTLSLYVLHSLQSIMYSSQSSCFTVPCVHLTYFTSSPLLLWLTSTLIHIYTKP